MPRNSTSSARAPRRSRSVATAASQPRSPRRRMRRTGHLDFAAIEIIGALLSPDLLAKVAAIEASGQSDQSYSVPPGLRLADEISRYFTIGEALWQRFTLARDKSASASEAFVLDLLKQCFGFDGFAKEIAIRVEDRAFPVRHIALGGRVPVVIAPAPEPGTRKPGVDESLQTFADGNRRRSATLLLQEYLNADDRVLWGLAADGCTLRLMRDNASLTRPAWIEADLARIFTDRLFADFALLWLFIHASRFGAPGAAPSDCALERWREEGRAAGTAARENLRTGVEMALIELGQGFIEDTANGALRQSLSDGSLSQQAFFEQLLRVIYRLIFLFAAEDRGMLHPADTSREQRDLYATGYSVGRLRERALRRTAWDRHGDVWASLSITFAALGSGEKRLGLPALGGLFAAGQTPALDGARLANRRLLASIWRLSWMRPEGQPLTRVNWRDMETEELGSVYESLLELVPRANATERTFKFANIEESRGSARKTTGSYYTPDPLVKLLLDTTLDPVLDAAAARNADDPATEILKLSIIDPACGSGHFLLGAARRAAGRIAKIRSPGAPSQVEFQHALREVVGRCIYGVDRNPMAVELCKVALWIEALEPGRPLTFLDARIRCGDSLIGIFDYAVLKDGIPDEAYKPLTGDDKDTTKAYAAINKEEREGVATDGLFEALKPPKQLIDDAIKVSAMPQDTLEQVAAVENAFARLHAGANWLSFKTACDMYIAAFFAPKVAGDPGEHHRDKPIIPTTDHVWAAIRSGTADPDLAAKADEIARRIHAFHWPLEFPQVFAAGGFDVVVGNPPWERIKLKEKEFFAARSPDIANAQNKKARERMIGDLAKADIGTRDKTLFNEFVQMKREGDAASEFARGSGSYPLTGSGDVNTYALFAELFSKLARSSGRSGGIFPSGIATDYSCRMFFQDIVGASRLVQCLMFDNAWKLFPAVHPDTPFAILCIGSTQALPIFCGYALSVEHALDPRRRFTLSSNQIQRINPNTRTAPIFRSRADAELAAKLYDQSPVLVEERSDTDEGNESAWRITFQRMFHMSDDSHLFSTERELLTKGWKRNGTDWILNAGGSHLRQVPLYGQKMMHRFDHRWGTYEGGAEDDDSARDVTLREKQNPDFEPQPRYWVPETEVQIRAARVPTSLKRAWRDDAEVRHSGARASMVEMRSLFDAAVPISKCSKVLAQWLLGYFLQAEGRPTSVADLNRILGQRGWDVEVGRQVDQWLMDEKVQKDGASMQRDTPLTADDIRFIEVGPREINDLSWELIVRKCPRWLLGWRRSTNATNERTYLSSVLPLVGAGDSIFFWHSTIADARLVAANFAAMNSLCFDFLSRQKIGGLNFSYYILQQLPAPGPAAYSTEDVRFIVPRVLELTYTSQKLVLWAEDLGHVGPPFSWNEDRRAQLSAELDAYIFRKYGLTRDELRFVLDPADAMGPDYPSETFRVLKEREIGQYGEYRTRRLVLEAWDKLGES